MGNAIQTEPEVKKAAITKKRGRNKKNSDQANLNSKNFVEDIIIDGENWKQRLLKVNESKGVLKYKVSDNSLGVTSEYLFEPGKIEFEKSLSLRPDLNGGEVYYNKSNKEEKIKDAPPVPANNETVKQAENLAPVPSVSELAKKSKDIAYVPAIEEIEVQAKKLEDTLNDSGVVGQLAEKEVVSDNNKKEDSDNNKKEELPIDETVRFLSMGGLADVEIPGVKTQVIELLNTNIVVSKEGNVEVFLLFGKPIVFNVEEDERYRLELNNGRYVKLTATDNGTMYFYGSNLYYKDKPLAEGMMLEADQKGLHMNVAGDLIIDQKKLDKEALEEFGAEEQILLSFEEDGPKLMSLGERVEEVSYETLDGRAEVVDTVYDSKSDSSTGDLILHDFLLRYVSPKEHLILAKQMKTEDKKIEGVTVTFSDKRQELINVEQKKEHRLDLEIEPEGEFKGVTVQIPLVLENIGIKDGNLVIGNARVDVKGSRSSNETTEDETKLQKLFNCTIVGSVAYSSESVTTSKEAIEIKEGNVTLGSFSVEDFLGFLSGQGDYLDKFVEVKINKEKEADTSKLFQFGEENLSEGLEISLPQPLDFMGVKIKVEPSASIGGEIGAKMTWGDKTLSLENGYFDANGNASMTGEIELDAKAIIASAALVLSGNLSAQINSNASVGTSFTWQNEKMEQASDFTFRGEAKANLDAGVSFASNIKVLFWKKKLFKLEKEKKGLVETGIVLEGSKSKDGKGIKEGWKIKDGRVFFKALSQEYVKQIKLELSEPEKEAKIDALLADAGSETEEVWMALVELKRKGNEVGILIEEGEKNKLEPQITKMQEKATDKIEKYKDIAEKEKKRLEKVIKSVEEELAAEKTLLESIRQNAELLDGFRQKALWGGFDEKKYDNASPEMTSIDFIIYNVLGEISKENLEQVTKEERSHEHKWKTMSEDVKEEIYHEKTGFGVAGDYTVVDKYKKDASYYRILHKRVADLKEYLMTAKEWKTESEIKEKIEKNEEEYTKLEATLSNEENGLYNTLKQCKEKNEKEKIQKKIKTTTETINSLFTKNLELDKSIDNIFIHKFPDKYREIIRTNPELTVRELLEIAVKDEYGEKTIDATAEDKEKLLEACFYTKFKAKGTFIKLGEEKASGAWRKEIDATLKERVKDRNDIMRKDKKGITLETLVKEASKVRAFELIASSGERMAKRKENIAESEAEKERLITRISQMEQIKKDCIDKLKALKENTTKALDHKNMDANAAKTAVDIYTEDYLGKLNPIDEERKDLEKRQEKVGV